jgi:hypothetical protein
MAASQFYLQSEKQRKVGCVENDSHAKNFHGEKGSVTQCTVMMQQPVLLSQEFFTRFQAVALKCQYYAELTVWPVWLNSSRTIPFALHLSCLFQSP